MKRVVVAPALAVVFTVACAPEWVVWHGHDPERQRDVRVVERGRSQHLLVDDREIGAHAAIGVDGLVMAARHIAYPARDGLAWRIYLDGAAESGSWESVGAMALGSHGALAYAAERGDRWSVITPGRTSGPYDSVSALGFDDRDRAIWAAASGGTTRVMVDGVAGPPWKDVRDVHFSPVVRYIATNEDGERFVRESEASVPFEEIVETTDDGFIAKTKKGRVVFVDGKRVGEGEAHFLATAAGHFAYARLAERGGERLVRDGVDDAVSFSRIDGVSMSADGRHVGWVGQHEESAIVVVDGRNEGTFAWARAPVFAAASSAFIYTASMGAGALVRGPRAHAAFDVVIEDSLVITADGAHWAAVGGYASNRRLYVVIDGAPKQAFDLDEWLAERVRLRGQNDGERLRRQLRAELARCYAPHP